MRCHLPPNTLLTPTPGATTEWCVGESRILPQSKEPEGPFGDTGHGPLLPKIMELDILQKRQTDALLGKTTHWLVLSVQQSCRSKTHAHKICIEKIESFFDEMLNFLFYYVYHTNRSPSS